MRLTFTNCLRGLAPLLLVSSAPAASIIFDDFNTNEGHFNLAPTFSGSNANIAPSSTADQITAESPIEGAGQEKIVINQLNAGATMRLRFLSGGGTAANNVAFTTSSGEDGWIGFYLKTINPDWTAQIWLEGQENNGAVPKAVIADGEWHLYEWNLDDETGGPDGWGSVQSIVSGDPDFENGSYTIDSIILRGPDVPTSTFYLDFVAKSASGSVAALIPEPTTFSSAAVGLVALSCVRRRKSQS